MKKIFLIVLVVSVVLSAVIGITVILIGEFGEFQQKVLLTTFTIACASILGLACGPAYESGRARPVALAGIVFAAAAAVSWNILIWSEGNLGDIPVRTIMSVTVIAAALSHVSLVSLARLEAKFRWALLALYISEAGLIGLLLSLIWFTDSVESDVTFRILGVLSILVAALTILMPVLHKLSDRPLDAARLDAEIAGLRERIAELEAKRASLEE